MTQGRFIAVVGPSGAGKDSVMAGICDALPGVQAIRRVITRAPGLGGEDYVAATPDEFEDLAQTGAFAIHWNAHGLRYGIPASALDHLASGGDCLANLSRSALLDAAGMFPGFLVLNVTAKPETLSRRLAARGRETPQDIENRLAQANRPLPKGLTVINLPNDGPLAETVAQAVAQIQPVRV